MGKFEDELDVLRGGQSKAEDLIANQKNDDLMHISAKAAVGFTYTDLLRELPYFRHRQFTYTTVGKIRALYKDWDVIESSNRYNPHHASIVCHNLEEDPDAAEKLSGVFEGGLNPYYVRGRRKS